MQFGVNFDGKAPGFSIGVGFKNIGDLGYVLIRFGGYTKIGKKNIPDYVEVPHYVEPKPWWEFDSTYSLEEGSEIELLFLFPLFTRIYLEIGTGVGGELYMDIYRSNRSNYLFGYLDDRPRGVLHLGCAFKITDKTFLEMFYFTDRKLVIGTQILLEVD
jgi:hypothetical protein